MRSAATKLAPEPEPTLADLWELMIQTRSEVAETSRLVRQARAGRDDDDIALILTEARLDVLGDAIDGLSASVAIASLTPGAPSGPVAVPGPATVPSQRTAPRHPLMSVVRP